jgi:hypothetical protein
MIRMLLIVKTTSYMASHPGGPGSNPGVVMWDLWWTKWRWGRFSPSTRFPLPIFIPPIYPQSPLWSFRYWGSHELSVFGFSSSLQHPRSVLPVAPFGFDRSSACFMRSSCLRIEKSVPIYGLQSSVRIIYLRVFLSVGYSFIIRPK